MTNRISYRRVARGLAAMWVFGIGITWVIVLAAIMPDTHGVDDE